METDRSKRSLRSNLRVEFGKSRFWLFLAFIDRLWCNIQRGVCTRCKSQRARTFEVNSICLVELVRFLLVGIRYHPGVYRRYANQKGRWKLRVLRSHQDKAPGWWNLQEWNGQVSDRDEYRFTDAALCNRLPTLRYLISKKATFRVWSSLSAFEAFRRWLRATFKDWIPHRARLKKWVVW